VGYFISFIDNNTYLYILLLPEGLVLGCIHGEWNDGYKNICLLLLAKIFFLCQSTPRIHQLPLHRVYTNEHGNYRSRNIRSTSIIHTVSGKVGIIHSWHSRKNVLWFFSVQHTTHSVTCLLVLMYATDGSPINVCCSIFTWCSFSSCKVLQMSDDIFSLPTNINITWLPKKYTFTALQTIFPLHFWSMIVNIFSSVFIQLFQITVTIYNNQDSWL
jgi:hypothetical protein